MGEPPEVHSEAKREWVEAFRFVNRQAADLVKFLTIIGSLWVLSYVFHVMKLRGVMAEGRIDLMENIDYAGSVAVLTMLVCDLVLKAFLAAFGGFLEKSNR